MKVCISERSKHHMLNKGRLKMTTNSLLFTATLALAGIANAKSYDITLSTPMKAGSLQLAAGHYSLKVQGTDAVFTNTQTGKSFTTAVKAETVDKKCDVTAVVSDTKDGDSHITPVELGGSTTKLELGD
jgi:hypothetical protein